MPRLQSTDFEVHVLPEAIKQAFGSFPPTCGGREKWKKKPLALFHRRAGNGKMEKGKNGKKVLP